MARVFGIGGASRRRKLGVVFVALAVALAVAGFAYPTGGPNAQLVGQDRLYGGGGTDAGCFVPDIGFCRLATTDFSVDAHATGTGNAAYGDIVARNGSHSQVTCLAVDGGNAVVGTRILTDPNPDHVGWLTATFYVDNGPGQVDLVSPNYTGPDDPADWPLGFPFVCPSPDTGSPAFGLIRSFIPISRGNIVVQDGRN